MCGNKKKPMCLCQEIQLRLDNGCSCAKSNELASLVKLLSIDRDTTGPDATSLMIDEQESRLEMCSVKRRIQRRRVNHQHAARDKIHIWWRAMLITTNMRSPNTFFHWRHTCLRGYLCFPGAWIYFSSPVCICPSLTLHGTRRTSEPYLVLIDTPIRCLAAKCHTKDNILS